MTVGKATGWGHQAASPSDLVFAHTNREVFRQVNDGVRELGLLGGDLWRTVGGQSVVGRNTGTTTGTNAGSNRDALPMHLPVDLISLSIDGDHVCHFTTHLIGCDLFRTVVVAAMNADFWRQYQLGPRAHPGDGVVDVYVAERLGMADLLRMRPRARSGLHVPHPKIRLERSADVNLELHKTLSVVADDVKVGRGRVFSLQVQPDALTIIV
jgi:hypothetical protein